ncbi:MAG: hypothetical protein MJA27_20900, partial [Pseudanabaenales cyanobacterium]|nr:hypothetical protein [Pseudanabaenales cyanobacterium]
EGLANDIDWRLCHPLNQAHRQYVDSEGLVIDQQLLPFAPISYAVGVQSLQEKIPLPLSTIALANVLPLTITFYIIFYQMTA